ncbi:P-loop containing nucleoside triphosphate hydrolase protein [Kalaharituber pfeilii]|nr:P-loop containing nucleoside triphosphate hydrolase protein [Kalaharituber pfeilii]
MTEAAGFAIGIVGLAGQLVQLSRECTNIFSDMKEIGYAQDSVLHDLREQGLRLKHWEHAWGLDGTSQQHQRIEPDDERYRYAVAGLARIIAVFAKLAALQARYQSEPQKDDKSAKRDSLGVGRLLSKFRSKSPSPGKTKPGRATSPSPQLSIPSISSSDLRLLEDPKIFSNTQLLPALEEEIACLGRAVQNVQQSVSAYRKLRWASSDKARCHELVGQLTKYIDGLFNVLPPNATIPRLSERKLLHLSFDIPFSLPNFQRNSDFVGREHLLEQLKQKIEGATTKKVILVVLYGMGGVGKTQLALEYAYRHHGDYSAVFWINAASEQTMKLGFTSIMQQLIKHHAKLCGEPDYMHIGRLLGMAGKLNSVGLFTVQDPSEEQYVVDAVKEWFAAKDNTKWLLVFDNLDDLRSFDINNYIPSSSYGTVIITSRRRESVHGRGWIEVDQMTKLEAEELLLKSAKRDFEKVTEGDCEHEKEAAATIVEKLGYLPLAIDQAGACIYALDSSFSRYLSEYENKVTYLLSTEWKLGTHDRAVFAAWDLSFNAIQEQNANAAELLLLCGFLDNNDICEELLQRGMKLPMNDCKLEKTQFGYYFHTQW